MRGDLETIGDWAGKYHGAVLRIAGVLHVVQQAMADPQAPVSGQTMADAIAIGRYFLEHAKAAYMLMGRTNRPRARSMFCISSKSAERTAR